MLLENRICLVTGGGSGIGRATVLRMLDEGAEAVVIADRDEEGASQTRSMAAPHKQDRVHTVVVDVSDERSVGGLAAFVDDRFGRLDVLHNNAGVVEANFTDTPSLAECPVPVWDRVMDVNLKGTWLCIKHATPLLRRSSAGAIVNCASVSGHTAVAGEAVYGVSKAAVIQLTRAAAAELAPWGIRCNCYSPAAIDTPMTRGDGLDEAALRRLTSRYLIDRLGSSHDVAALVCFLASDQSSFITGTDVAIDGGLLAWPGRRG